MGKIIERNFKEYFGLFLWQIPWLVRCFSTPDPSKKRKKGLPPTVPMLWIATRIFPGVRLLHRRPSSDHRAYRRRPRHRRRRSTSRSPTPARRRCRMRRFWKSCAPSSASVIQIANTRKWRRLVKGKRRDWPFSDIDYSWPIKIIAGLPARCTRPLKRRLDKRWPSSKWIYHSSPRRSWSSTRFWSWERTNIPTLSTISILIWSAMSFGWAPVSVSYLSWNTRFAAV